MSKRIILGLGTLLMVMMVTFIGADYNVEAACSHRATGKWSDGSKFK